MIVKEELLAGDNNEKLSITLSNGSKIVGTSLGIETEEDEEGNEYDVLAFQCPDLLHIFWFKNEEIKEVELAK